ncbi:MAG: shikimate dehydrogenase [Anaerolineae bacterium]
MSLPTQTMPTMYFIGVTTTQSSMMKIFPLWAEILGLKAQLVGHDIAIGAPPEAYREIVAHIKHDPMSQGGLVTTHKIDLLAATREMFDELDDFAQLTQEVSAVAKRGEKLRGAAKDPITSGLAMEAFIPAGHWTQTGGEVLCLGAGGAGVSISVNLARRKEDYPQRFIIVDIDQARLNKLKALHDQLETPVKFEYMLNSTPDQNDMLMLALPPGSLVINATGMGKDRPGSPLTDKGVFPENGLVWELNYRGERQFMQQAHKQAEARHLTIEDGWVYFVHGWSQVVAEVFDLQLTPEIFRQLDEAAASIR